ncbi:MAG: type II secretion system minor pseudopilin GspK [Deltaproteobacteria bacterium]|nr:type II secretion system minor pseudopilin GspK [Deltaproteobacteria bacterium]
MIRIYIKVARGNNSGIALLMAVFVISLASIVVMGLSYQSRFDFRASRAFAEGIQADYVLKSGLNVAKTLIQLPKEPDQDNRPVTQDSLRDMWARVDSLGPLNQILSGVAGEIRIQIIDEDSKLNVNNIVTSGHAAPANNNTNNNSNSSTGANNNQPQQLTEAEFWQETLRQIFFGLGFEAESFDENEFRTFGNKAYNAQQQVAVLHDWIDQDTKPADDGGMESGKTKGIFYNRQLRSMSEILLVPGITLERLNQISPFVTAVSSKQGADKKLNINTVPFEVLRAMGVPETQAAELVQERLGKPITQEILNTLAQLVDTPNNPSLRRLFKLNSSNFSVIVRVKGANSVRWLKALVNANGLPPQRKTKVTRIEFF